MACQFSLNKAHADLAVIATVKENFRSHLLMALSEARSATLSLEPALRETLLDDVSKYFHPDAAIADYFTDAFTDAELAAQNRIDELTDEMALERRTPARMDAAE